MTERKQILRTCVVSHEVCEKKDLIRVVRTPLGEVIIDPKGKANGRGAYLKKDLEVFNKAQKSKILDRHLEVSVPDSIFESLKELL